MLGYFWLLFEDVSRRPAEFMSLEQFDHGQSSKAFFDVLAVVDFDVPSHCSEDLVSSVGMHI